MSEPDRFFDPDEQVGPLTQLPDEDAANDNTIQRLVRSSFIDRMEKELQANERKGDWRTWNPEPTEAMGELNHHLLKLAIFLGDKNKDKVSELAADVANISMKISELFGAT